MVNNEAGLTSNMKSDQENPSKAVRTMGSGNRSSNGKGSFYQSKVLEIKFCLP
jgi:hypothetical protein